MKLTTAGAIVAGLVIGIPLAVEHAFSEETGSTSLAYVPFEEITEASGDTPAPAASTELSGDVDRGKKRFATCRACHSIRDNGRHGVGPNLLGVVNRPVASAEGYKYTPALTGLGGIWSPDRLDAYLEAPTTFAPGTTMVLPTASADDRTDIIAYLASLVSEEEE